LKNTRFKQQDGQHFRLSLSFNQIAIENRPIFA